MRNNYAPCFNRIDFVVIPSYMKFPCYFYSFRLSHAFWYLFADLFFQIYLSYLFLQIYFCRFILQTLSCSKQFIHIFLWYVLCCSNASLLTLNSLMLFYCSTHYFNDISIVTHFKQLYFQQSFLDRFHSVYVITWRITSSK